MRGAIIIVKCRFSGETAASKKSGDDNQTETETNFQIDPGDPGSEEFRLRASRLLNGIVSGSWHEPSSLLLSLSS